MCGATSPWKGNDVQTQPVQIDPSESPTRDGGWPQCAPLLGVIVNEVAERTRARRDLQRLRGQVERRRERDERLLLEIDARLSAHGRGIRLARRELARLGWRQDPRDARVLHRIGGAGDGPATCDLRLSGAPGAPAAR
jgi:hypothetical protein